MGIQRKAGAVLDDRFLQPTGVPDGDETGNISSSQGMDARQHCARKRSNSVPQTRHQKTTIGK